METTIVREESKQSIKRKSKLREWVDSILFAVGAALIIRWLFFSAFVIPTPSMENSLLVGDFLFVSRLHYGTATPITPLQVPLSHQKIWGTNIPSYLDWIQLPQFRLPGFTEIKRGDVVVFNLPVEHPKLYQKYGRVLPDLTPHPTDLRSNYIKRCMGAPGDQVSIKNGQVYVNGKATVNPAGMQEEYFVRTNGSVNEMNVFKKNGITDYSQYTETFKDTITGNDVFGYLVKTTKENIDIIKRYDFVKGLESIHMSVGLKEPDLFPASELHHWNKDQYGPILVPKKGLTVKLTPESIALYADIIQYFDHHENAKIEGNIVTLDGKVISEYTFQQDYYFMMGDNRHNSADSRYWGFVPNDHIVGKAVFVWMSIDPDPVSFINKIRWSRVFRTIK